MNIKQTASGWGKSENGSASKGWGASSKWHPSIKYNDRGWKMNIKQTASGWGKSENGSSVFVPKKKVGPEPKKYGELVVASSYCHYCPWSSKEGIEETITRVENQLRTCCFKDDWNNHRMGCREEEFNCFCYDKDIMENVFWASEILVKEPGNERIDDIRKTFLSDALKEIQEYGGKRYPNKEEYEVHVKEGGFNYFIAKDEKQRLKHVASVKKYLLKCLEVRKDVEIEYGRKRVMDILFWSRGYWQGLDDAEKRFTNVEKRNGGISNELLDNEEEQRAQEAWNWAMKEDSLTTYTWENDYDSFYDSLIRDTVPCDAKGAESILTMIYDEEVRKVEKLYQEKKNTINTWK